MVEQSRVISLDGQLCCFLLDAIHVNGESSGVGTTQDHRMRWDATAKETDVLGQERFKAGLSGPCVRIRDELADERLTCCRQREFDLDDRSVEEQRPKDAGHQRRPQIS
jgi:hypothetical protein